MAQLEVDKGFKLFFRHPARNSYGFLNVREAFAADHADVTERVLKNYEKARLWSLDHSEEARSILQKAANMTPELAEKFWERTDLTNPKVGADQKQVILDSAKVLKANGIVDANTDIEKTIAELRSNVHGPNRHSQLSETIELSTSSNRVKQIDLPRRAVEEPPKEPRLSRSRKFSLVGLAIPRFDHFLLISSNSRDTFKHFSSQNRRAIA